MDQPTTPPPTGDTPPAAQALTNLTTALDQLITIAEADGLAALPDEPFAALAKTLEHTRNRIGLVDHQIIHDADRRNLGHTWLMRNTTGLLSHLLHITRAEARDRQDAADAIAPRTSMHGETLPAKRPELAAAFRAGHLNPRQLNRAIDTLDTLDKGGVDPADVTKAETELTDLGTQFEPIAFDKAAKKMIDVHFPDGKLDDERHHRMRDFHLKQNPDGSFTPGGRITPALGAKFHATLSPLAKPQTGEGSTLDARDTGQRMHDAIEMAFDRLLRTGTLPDSGGTPATVIVTIQLEDLLARTGCGITTDGILLSTDEILRIANEAEIIPAIFRRHGLPLDLGRSRRIANRNQTLALIARDIGCTFPGCTIPADWCQRHHILGWLDDGKTKIENLTLLCGYHHRSFAQAGWTCKMINHLPHWIPPPWHDPEQKPQLHHQIRQRLKPTT